MSEQERGITIIVVPAGMVGRTNIIGALKKQCESEYIEIKNSVDKLDRLIDNFTKQMPEPIKLEFPKSEAIKNTTDQPWKKKWKK